MHWDRDGMMVVRAELCDRLDTLQQAGARLTVRDFSAGMAQIRTLAAAYGLTPVVCLAEAFERVASESLAISGVLPTGRQLLTAFLAALNHDGMDAPFYRETRRVAAAAGRVASFRERERDAVASQPLEEPVMLGPRLICTRLRPFCLAS